MSTSMLLSEVSDEINDLDDNWIIEFEKQDLEYKNYYKEDIHFINLHFIYINEVNCIEKMKEETYFLKNNNVLSREELLSIIKINNIENSIQYGLLALLKYNINLEPINLKTYLKSSSNLPEYNYLTTIKNIDYITFKPSISCFHDLNSLYIVFYTKSGSFPTNFTKKITIQKLKKNNNSKTIRKSYKDSNI
jgi:hypothetical protein